MESRRQVVRELPHWYCGPAGLEQLGGRGNWKLHLLGCSQIATNVSTREMKGQFAGNFCNDQGYGRLKTDLIKILGLGSLEILARRKLWLQKRTRRDAVAEFKYLTRTRRVLVKWTKCINKIQFVNQNSYFLAIFF